MERERLLGNDGGRNLCRGSQSSGLAELLRPELRNEAHKEDEHKLDTMTQPISTVAMTDVVNNFAQTYRSLVIIKMPCTRKPLRSWGPIPLNKLKAPSFLTMNSITSTKLLKGLPLRAAGGLDCRPTLATMRGWVTMVAIDLDKAPRTKGELVSEAFHEILQNSQTYGTPPRA